MFLPRRHFWHNLLPVTLSVLLFFALALLADADLVINEIMYRPGTAFPENTGLEFIELYNPDGVAVDVGGWALTSGVAIHRVHGINVPLKAYLHVNFGP